MAKIELQLFFIIRSYTEMSTMPILYIGENSNELRWVRIQRVER